ncbi:MAG TPA: PEP-CTERM sorting domain-containing protein [Tepidisphaeraceae bacterium]|jgi:hypothetical protein|nr:PEP-CTERM sorting domain-containing protein [Tepidisphaeraceae bacterium]
MIGTNRAAAFISALILAATAAHAAILVDLTTAGSSGIINGAIYQQVQPQPTGTGTLNTFLRMQRNGVEQGFNTDFRPTLFDEMNDSTSLLLSRAPKVTIDGTIYREFLLDINENNSSPLLSLNDVEIFLGIQPDAAGFANLGTMVYKMDAAANNSVKLDSSLNNGSGSGDMLLYVPDSNFADVTGPYVYLFSRFGQAIPNDNSDVTSDGGFEEWSAGKKGPNGTIVPITPVPEPASLSLLIVASATLLRRRGR